MCLVFGKVESSEFVCPDGDLLGGTYTKQCTNEEVYCLLNATLSNDAY